MNCAADNSINRHGSIRSFALALLLGALALTALAVPRAAVEPTGVRNSSGPQRLNEKQLQQVQESLRHKSGFMELVFDEQGALTLGNRQHIAGGSATARALLIAAVDSGNLYELESHERSPKVAFARIDESVDRLIDDRESCEIPSLLPLSDIGLFGKHRANFPVSDRWSHSHRHYTMTS